MDHCEPNITTRGQRRRRKLGVLAGVVAVTMLVAAWTGRVPLAARGLVFVPAFVSGLGLLQARRQTCVVRALEGVIERDAARPDAASAEAVRASRRVAWTIVRDALLLAILATTLALAPVLSARPAVQ